MGITIYYRGKLNNTNMIEPFCNEIEDIAKDMNWEYNLLDNDLQKPNSSQIENGEIIGHIPLKGISINIHNDVDTLSFYFNKDGFINDLVSMTFLSEDELNKSSNFIKTQFAPIQIHITIIKLLRYIKSKYINNLEVTDDGDYWESHNKEILQEKFNFLDKKISEIENLLSDTEFKKNETVESMVYRIEKILKNYLK